MIKKKKFIWLKEKNIYQNHHNNEYVEKTTVYIKIKLELFYLIFLKYRCNSLHTYALYTSMFRKTIVKCLSVVLTIQ